MKAMGRLTLKASEVFLQRIITEAQIPFSEAFHSLILFNRVTPALCTAQNDFYCLSDQHLQIKMFKQAEPASHHQHKHCSLSCSAASSNKFFFPHNVEKNFNPKQKSSLFMNFLPFKRDVKICISSHLTSPLCAFHKWTRSKQKSVTDTSEILRVPLYSTRYECRTVTFHKTFTSVSSAIQQ